MAILDVGVKLRRFTIDFRGDRSDRSGSLTPNKQSTTPSKRLLLTLLIRDCYPSTVSKER